ncbi:MAG: cupin domain-containing protein [Spirochaetota bacterium]
MNERQSSTGTPSETPEVRRIDDVAAVDCPCGAARRVFSRGDGGPLGIHRVTISRNAKRHYHKHTTEYYIIIEGSGEIELNDERIAVSAGDIVYIPPYTRHAARGRLEIMNVVYPPFDPTDEYLDEDGGEMESYAPDRRVSGR